MLEDIKKELLKDPERIKELLGQFGYCNIAIRPTYIQFGRDADSSKKSIVIRLENNSYLYVHDYARNINKDIFSYIATQRNLEFVDILNATKKILNITDYYDFFNRKGIFGGFYERIRKRTFTESKIQEESVLNQFEYVPNLRFLRDHISLESQRYFGIRYDIESQGIVIPIRDSLGQLIGVKERFNYKVDDGDMKYFYSIPCRCSTTLFGYSQNYQYLVDGTIFIGEAEKFVMQCYSYGYRNALALMSGSLSIQQAKLILSLHPKKVIFLHDQGYEKENILKNIDILKRYSRFSELDVGYWNWQAQEYPSKVSPTDMGKEVFERIIREEIVMIGDDEDEL